MSKIIHVIINPASGHPEPVLNTLNSVFREAGADWDVSLTHKSGDAQRAALEAVEKGVDVVAVYGGDGSVMEAAQGLMGSEVPLAILPGGTANLMSVELGIPRKLAEAARVTCSDTSKVRTVDMGKSDEGQFMLRVGIGLWAETVIIADRDMKDKYGLAAYSIATIKAAENSQAAKYKMDLDGEHVEVNGLACRVDNSSNIGVQGISLVSDADVSDGYFDVVVLRELDRDAIHSIIESARHKDSVPGAFYHWRAREIHIETDPPLPVQGDGEVWDLTPISIHVLPGAMRVLVPEN